MNDEGYLALAFVWLASVLLAGKLGWVCRSLRNDERCDWCGNRRQKFPGDEEVDGELHGRPRPRETWLDAEEFMTR